MELKHKRRAGRLALNVFAGAALAFLMLPLVVVVPVSFSSAPSLQFPPPGWSLKWYLHYATDAAWLEATLRSLNIAFWTMLLATCFGTLLAFALVRGRFPGRALLSQVAAAPLIVPTIVYAVAVYGLLSALKLIGNWQGIWIAHTVMAIPFVTLVVGAGLRTVDPSQELAAMGLGASRLGALWRITLPQIRPSLVSAAFLAFIASFDELVVAMFLGGTNVTLPKKMFDNIQLEIEPTVAVVSVLQIALVSLVLILAARFGTGTRAITEPDGAKAR